MLGNTQSISCAFALRNQKSALLKFCDLKQMEFCVDFGAEDAARLTRCKVDFPVGENVRLRTKGARTGVDKPKDTKITLFQAGSDYSLSAKKKPRQKMPQLCACEIFVFVAQQTQTTPNAKNCGKE